MGLALGQAGGEGLHVLQVRVGGLGRQGRTGSAKDRLRGRQGGTGGVKDRVRDKQGGTGSVKDSWCKGQVL